MNRLILLFIILFVTACKSTGYQPESSAGGFSEIQLDTNIFKVTYKGNGLTSVEEASDFSLLRSAELSHKHGFKYFVIVEEENYTKDSQYTTSERTVTNFSTLNNGSVQTQGNSINYQEALNGTATTQKIGGNTYHVSKPRSSNVIMCYHEKPNDFSYNVDFLIKSIKQKYKMSID